MLILSWCNIKYILINATCILLCSQSKENEEMRISLAELSSASSSDNNGSSSDDNDLDRDRDGEIWCVQDGRVYEQGEDWEVDSCTSCTCQVSVINLNVLLWFYKDLEAQVSPALSKCKTIWELRTSLILGFYLLRSILLATASYFPDRREWYLSSCLTIDNEVNKHFPNCQTIPSESIFQF